MRKLVQQIQRELKTAKHCAVYEEELTRVWPDDGNQREPKIAQFAEDNGFRLRFYRDGLCAIFDREPGSPLYAAMADALLAVDAARRHELQVMHPNPSLTQTGE